MQTEQITQKGLFHNGKSFLCYILLGLIYNRLTKLRKGMQDAYKGEAV